MPNVYFENILGCGMGFPTKPERRFGSARFLESRVSPHLTSHAYPGLITADKLANANLIVEAGLPADEHHIWGTVWSKPISVRFDIADHSPDRPLPFYKPNTYMCGSNRTHIGVNHTVPTELNRSFPPKISSPNIKSKYQTAFSLYQVQLFRM